MSIPLVLLKVVKKSLYSTDKGFHYKSKHVLNWCKNTSSNITYLLKHIIYY